MKHTICGEGIAEELVSVPSLVNHVSEVPPLNRDVKDLDLDEQSYPTDVNKSIRALKPDLKLLYKQLFLATVLR